MRHPLRHCLLIFACLLPVACRNEEALQTESNETFYQTNLDAKGLKLAQQVEDTLRVAGVCSLKIFPGNYGGRNIDSKDDVFTHFMLLANVESRLGDALSGVGGAGMFGTNLGHFDRNIQAKNPQNAQVFGCNNGGLSDSQIMKDHVRNAKCAFALYLANQGFRDWGSVGGPWGSNRKIPDLSQKLKSQLSRECEDPACRKSKIAWTDSSSDRLDSPGARGNILTVTSLKECTATKLAVKLLTTNKVDQRFDGNRSQAPDEWVEEVPPGSRKVTIDLVNLKRRNPNTAFKYVRIQLKRGNAILTTLPITQLPFSQD
jgi:hypothetical protein